MSTFPLMSVEHGSPFCDRLWLCLNARDHDFHIRFHESTPQFALRLMRDRATRLGYVVDSDVDPLADPYDDHVYDGDGMWRLVLTHKESIPDTQEFAMPDLSQTAYGPHSGFMEAV